MTGTPPPGRWTRVDELFHRAIEMDAAGRDAFLTRECGDDDVLEEDVRSLVAAHAAADRFIENPALARRAFELAIDTDATDTEDAPTLTGRTLGQYTVLHPIGRGGMGIVYLARDERLGRTVALKVLAPRLTRDPKQRDRLRREARLAGGVSHPGIATIHALEEFDGQLVIVSEYIEGRTLRDELADGAIAADVAQATALAIVQALSAAHAHGVVHRDLKPENVMRTRDGRIKLLDFGLAQLDAPSPDAPSAPRQTDTGRLLGTPAYMAPEQLRGRPSDARADLFAWGVLAYEIAAGRHPFAETGGSADTAAVIVNILEHQPPSLAAFAPNLPGGFVAVIEQCLAKEPASRPSSALEVIAAIEGAAEARTPTPRAVEAPDVAPALPRPVAPPLPLWWWRFHQLMTSIVYCAMLAPLWLARAWMPPRWGPLALVIGVATALSATTLRLHLWFTSRVYPQEWAAQFTRASRWIRLADLGLVTVLAVSGASMLGSHDSAASMFIAVSVAAFLASTIIEPATTRAAFRK